MVAVVISSLVVECLPEKTESITRELTRFKGVEVHSVEQGCKIVITVESETVDESYAETSKMIGIDGVTGVSLVYVNFEDDPTIYPDAGGTAFEDGGAGWRQASPASSNELADEARAVAAGRVGSRVGGQS